MAAGKIGCNARRPENSHPALRANVIGRNGNRAASRGIMSDVTRFTFLLATVVALAPLGAAAQTPFQGFAPHPPCGESPAPAGVTPDGPPAIAAWSDADLEKAAWRHAPCLHWGAGKMRMATALSAVFHAPSLDELLVRYGALSHYKSIRFWSILHQSWEEFVIQAGFTDGPKAAYTYPDLKAGDFVAGRDFYYYEIGRAGRTIHHLTIHQHSPDRAELTTENVTPVRAAVFTVFEPGALKTATVIERHGPQEWSYYQAIGVGEGSDFIAVRSASPYVNRLVALYRYMAGLQTDGAPPAAPH